MVGKLECFLFCIVLCYVDRSLYMLCLSSIFINICNIEYKGLYFKVKGCVYKDGDGGVFF